MASSIRLNPFRCTLSLASRPLRQRLHHPVFEYPKVDAKRKKFNQPKRRCEGLRSFRFRSHRQSVRRRPFQSRETRQRSTGYKNFQPLANTINAITSANLKTFWRLTDRGTSSSTTRAKMNGTRIESILRKNVKC